MTLPDIASINTYGGILTDAFPVEDPTTDRSADDSNDAYADVAGLTHTGIRAWVSFIGNATTPTDPVINVHDATWGNDSGVKPTVTRNSSGVYTIQWPTTVEDELENTKTLNLRRAWASFEGTVPYFHTATTGTSSVVLRVFNSGAALNDAVGVTITVFVI